MFAHAWRWCWIRCSISLVPEHCSTPAPLLSGEEEVRAVVRHWVRAVSPRCVLIPSVVASSSSPAPTCRSACVSDPTASESFCVLFLNTSYLITTAKMPVIMGFRSATKASFCRSGELPREAVPAPQRRVPGCPQPSRRGQQVTQGEVEVGR